MATLIPPSTAEVERYSHWWIWSQRLCINVYQLKIWAIVWGYVNFHEVLPRMIIIKSYCDGWKVLVLNQKPTESIIVYGTKKRTFSICIFIFICVRNVRGKKLKKYYLLLYAHKSDAYFLLFLKSLKFLKPRYFLKYKSNVLKYL